jgi:HPt (histidine-containing phosphotransfer) domain-containing protein
MVHPWATNAMRLGDVLNATQALAAAGDDPAVAEDLVKRFLTILVTARADLNPTEALRDTERLRTCVHRLCSGGLYLGFERIGTAARTFESHLTNHAPPEETALALTALNEAIQAALEPGEAAVLAWLKSSANSLTH